MQKSFIDKEKNRLIKEFHIKLKQYKIEDYMKEAILSGYGVTSSKELNCRELLELNDLLDREHNGDYAELDKLRKRVMASIGAFLRALHKQENDKIIKSIACRAAKYENFNDIPASKLRAIYSEFTKQTKGITGARAVTSEMIGNLASLN